MNLTRRSTEVRGGRRLAMVVACVAIGAATCVSALALRMGVAGAGQDGAGQDKAPKVLSVKASVMARNRISGENPVYPAEAKANKDTVDGPVVLSVLINQEGVPVDILVKQSLRADYDRSALDAVQQWRWKPFLLNGDPVEVKTTVTVTYSAPE
jgi:TonB family protein